MYKLLIRPVLFLFDPEKVHDFVCVMLKFPFIIKVFKFIYNSRNLTQPHRLCGLTFRNPVGLAAGFDKNAELVDQLTDLGFGFIEIGTVTPLPQSGNEKPRMFRLKKDSALINQMGFNNAGVEVVRANLKKCKHLCLIGGNIGKNKDTPNDQAIRDYEICFKRLHDVVDYFVVNVSSPNTPGLRELQDAESLTKILNRLQSLNKTEKTFKPIFLKIAPDLTEVQLDKIIHVVLQTKIAGIIATNTTIERQNLKTRVSQVEKYNTGGLSGKPLFEKSTGIIQYISQKSEGAFPVIGVGGIHSANDAKKKVEAGAALVQLYTGFIYEGPGLISKVVKGLAGIN